MVYVHKYVLNECVYACICMRVSVTVCLYEFIHSLGLYMFVPMCVVYLCMYECTRVGVFYVCIYACVYICMHRHVSDHLYSAYSNISKDYLTYLQMSYLRCSLLI